MNELMNELVQFCRAEPEANRFFSITFTTDPTGTQDWCAEVYLGGGYTADGAKVVNGQDRWLENHAGSVNVALAKLVERLSTVRKLKR